MAFPTASIPDSFNRSHESPMTGWNTLVGNGREVASNQATLISGASIDAYGTALWIEHPAF
jgi:hypothetical protein